MFYDVVTQGKFTKQNEHIAYHLNGDFVFALLLIGGE